jgi:hypothetical protein
MKKSIILGAAVITGLFLTASAQAQIITSVQFNGNGASALNSTASGFNYTAGAIPVDNWNVELSTGNTTNPQSLTVTSGLITSTGTTSGVGFSLQASGAYYSGAGTGFTSTPPYPGYPGQTTGPGDGFLYASLAYAGYSDSNPLTLSVTGLNSSDTYDLLVYVTPFAGFGENQTATLSLSGGPTYYATTDGAAGTYEPITSTVSTSPTTGNYAEFTGLTGATSQTLTFTNTGSLDGISGFQVVDLGPATAPEPSTWALIMVGLLTLAIINRRRDVCS